MNHRHSPLITTFIVLSFVLAAVSIACSSPPVAEFTTSSTGGPVPHEVNFTPVETDDSASFRWEFGDGATSDERSPMHTYQDAGEFTVRLTVSGGGSDISAEQSVTTEPGEAGWIIVEPSSLVLESGERAAVDVSAFDALGNPVPDAGFVWSANAVAGSVLDDGTFVAGPETGTYSDALTVEYERLGVTASAAVSAEIVLGELDSIVIDPPAINVRVNSRLDLKVVARDRQGHVLAEPDIEWKPVREGVDTVLPGGEFRSGVLPTMAEQSLLNVAVTVDGVTKEQIISGSIATGILDRLDVKPSVAATAIGTPVSLKVEAFDRFGNLLELDSVEWQIASDTYGEITPDGVFTPSGAAVFVTEPLVTVIGELDRVSSFAEISLDILPGPAVGITLVPAVDSVPVGSGNPYLALVIDEFGNVISEADVTWSVSGGGEITDTGVFIAGFQTGEFKDSVTATVAAGVYGNAEELVTLADITVRDRSSDLIAVEISNAAEARIMLIDLTTADRLPVSEELDNDAASEVSPSWWPDGSRLVYTSDISGKVQVYDIEIETGEIRQLVDDPDGSTMGVISPDGTRIAYLATIGDTWQLYVAELQQPDSEGDIIPVTREQAMKLSVDDEAQSLIPFWSPDGSEIAFSSASGATVIELFAVAADGSSPPRLLGDLGLSGFSWSPDGQFILAIDNASTENENLGFIEADSGAAAGRIPLPFQVFLAAWAPDGSELAVVDRVTGAMWLVDSDGSSLRQVVGSQLNPLRSAWRPVPLDAAAVLARAEQQP